MAISFADLNYWAVLAGAVFYMAFGALYFSPILFGGSWTRLNNIKDGHMSNPLIYVASTATAFLSSLLIAVLVQATSSDDPATGLATGLIVALAIALVYLKNAAFGLMPKKVYAIAVCEHAISFAALGLLHGLWH
ncbi:DUF1761 domain-containing protein [Paenibacillus arenilitoris]|uniref:DUF1761 domain-containing protein n=1 Tax=Paenibacillus arenilitoris TaxID=2772299 RepID=A0A927CN22_9BACL|nr:DUF1761 domain-containing protein [Paenibacillus arenilitoris]MBD2870297.1 DUF1761 domain-containing protein [Paenibacillus arenilitoris]